MAKILLVEDDKSLREIYGVRLMAEGYDITSAGDGEEALAVAIKERPDLIVSDVMMPKISGFDMLDILRSTTETKNIKVIMMTALSSEDQRARGEALGADRYLVKSQVGIEDVVRTVHDVLGDAIAAAPAPIAPTAAPAAPVEQPVYAAPVQQPAAPVAPASVEPIIATAPVAAPVAPTTPAPVAAPAPVVDYAPAPVSAPVVAPAQTVAPQTPQPVYEPTPAPTQYAAPTQPDPTPVAAPQPQPAANPIFTAPVAPAPVAAPTPAPSPFATPSTLPQPTAPFSSNPPASLGDRIINPLSSADSLQQGATDIAAQMNQELNAHLQSIETPAAAPTPAPTQYAAPTQPQTPTNLPPVPPSPGV